MWATLRRHSGIAAQIVQLFHQRFDPRLEVAEGRARRAAGRARRRDRDRARRGGEPRRGPHPAPLRQRGDVGAAHQLLSARRRRPAEGDHRDQVRQPQDRRPAAAEAAVRDLRLFAARRGRAPALRQGGARRHPLVGPAAGLPHRGARPGQGAAGEECRDRAGRRQGRLRAEAAAGRPARCRAGRGHRRLQDVHHQPARHHRQSRPRRRRSRPRTSCATTTTIPIWWSRPTRARRRSPIPRTASRSSTASGSATRSRRGGSAGYDHKKMGITARGRLGGRASATSARWTSTSARRRSRSRASATCRATCSATACCASAPSGWSRRSITATSSSIPIPIRRRSFDERQRLFDLSRSSWQDYNKDYISAGGGVYSRSAKEIALSAEARSAARARGREVDAAAGDDRDPQAQHRSALVRRHRHLHPRVERDRRPGRRPRQRSDPHHRRGAALQGGGRGRQSRHDAARPHRGGACAASGSTPTRSTIRPASTPPTSRSTSRSRSARRCATAGLTLEARNALLAEMTDEVAPPGAAQQLPADAGALARAAARRSEDLGFHQRLMQIAREQRAARPRGRIPARRHGARRAAQARTGADPARARGAARLRQALALRRPARIRGAGRSLSRARACALFPEPAGRALSRRARAAPPAPRDHLDAAHQFDDQSRRAGLRGAHRATRPARPRRRSRRRSSSCATATT